MHEIQPQPRATQKLLTTQAKRALYLPGSHIHMSRSRYTYRPIQHSLPLFSLHVTRTPLSTIIPHSIIGASTPPPKYDYLLLANRNTRIVSFIHTSISISLGASSIAHTPCHSISHPCSHITISRGSLYDKHTLSPPHVCIFSVRQSPVGHVLGVFSLGCKQPHTISSPCFRW